MSDKTERMESPWHSEPLVEGEGMSARTDRLWPIGGARGINRQCSIGWHDECSDPDGETCRCLCHGEQAKARIAAFDAHWSSEPQGKLPTADSARDFAKHDYLAGYDAAVMALQAARDEAVAQRDASRAVNAEFLAAQRPEVTDARDRRVQARALEEAAAWLHNGELCSIVAYDGPSNRAEVVAAYDEAIEDPAAWLLVRAAEIRKAT